MWNRVMILKYIFKNKNVCAPKINKYEAEFKEIERRLKLKPWLKYGLFHLKLYSTFQDLSRRSIEAGFFADLRRGSNSLNSDSDMFMYVFLFIDKYTDTRLLGRFVPIFYFNF